MLREDPGSAEDSEVEPGLEGNRDSEMEQGRWKRDLRRERWVFGSWGKVAGSMGC